MMRMISKVLIIACGLSIGSGCASASNVGCYSTKEVSNDLRQVKTESDSRASLELIGSVSDCLKARAKAGTIGDIDDSVIDQLMDLLNAMTTESGEEPRYRSDGSAQGRNERYLLWTAPTCELKKNFRRGV